MDKRVYLFLPLATDTKWTVISKVAGKQYFDAVSKLDTGKWANNVKQQIPFRPRPFTHDTSQHISNLFTRTCPMFNYYNWFSGHSSISTYNLRRL